MAVTLKDLVLASHLGLRVVAAPQALDREIRWVAVSDMVNPTPWLDGGELLLTTGLRLTDAADFDAYVDRIADASVAGLGFGVGVEHDTPPAPLLAAAERRNLPVLLVPYDVAYLAITRFVSDRAAADEMAALGDALEAQQTITEAALHGGVEGLVAALARWLDGWCQVTNAAGALIAASGTPSESGTALIAEEIAYSRDRWPGTNTVRLSADGSFLVQPLSVRGQLRGFLLVERVTPYSLRHRTATTAALLTTLELERDRISTGRVRRSRTDIVDRMLHGELPTAVARRNLQEWGLGGDGVRVCVLSCDPDDAASLLEQIDDALAEAQIRAATTLDVADGAGRVVAVVDADGAYRSVLVGFVDPSQQRYLGVGDQVPPDDLPLSWRHALRALDVGQIERRPVSDFAELGAMQLLLSLQRPEILTTFAQERLEKLSSAGADGDQLVNTLRVYLVNNGHWTESAEALGIHRHTLRARISRIEALTGFSLDSAYDRMEFWLALQINDLLSR